MIQTLKKILNMPCFCYSKTVLNCKLKTAIHTKTMIFGCLGPNKRGVKNKFLMESTSVKLGSQDSTSLLFLLMKYLNMIY